MVFAILKLLLKKKLRDRLKIYGSALDELKECFDDDCIPTELGGNYKVLSRCDVKNCCDQTENVSGS